MTLYDPSGAVIPAEVIAAMREEQAAPVLGGVRNIFAQMPADMITPWRLAQIHKAAAVGDTLAYQELAEDIEEREPQYLTVLSTRKNSVTQLPLNVFPASDSAEHAQHKAFVDDWLETEVLGDALFDILDGIGKGYSVHEIMWDVSAGGALPTKLTFRPQRWFEISREDGNTVLMRDGAGFVPLLPHKFVVHRHPAKSGLLLRSGLARVASWAWMLKSFTERDWATFVQNYGAPLRIGRYGPEASVSDKRVLWRAVSNIAGDCAAIIPKSMEVTFEQPPNVSGAGELHHKRVVYFDGVISKLVLGQTATTDANPGSHAAGRTHRLVQEDIERADAKKLATTITRQLVQLIVAFNFGPQKKYPIVHIGQTDDVPLEEVVKAMQFLGPQGLKLKASEVREQLGGFTEPEDDDDVVGGRPTAPQPPTPTVTSPALPTSSEDPPTAFAEPAKQGEKDGKAVMRMLLARHTRNADPETIGLLLDRTAEEAQGALAGLTHQVRNAIEAAHDMHDLAHRLSQLELEPEQFTIAMQRSLAIAHLVGQASLLDEIKGDIR